MPVQPLVDGDLTTRRVRMPAREVVFFKAVLEANEGIAAVFAERGGDLTVATPWSRRRELDELLADLVSELDIAVDNEPSS
jgi:hypothetical protein